MTSDGASITEGLPPFVLSNIVPVEITSHDAHYYLFPDRVITRPKVGWKFAATSYSSLDVEDTGVAFTWDTSAVPSDATVLRETWLYVRNDGGPDRRFANNARVPVLSLSEFGMTADTGLRLVVMASRVHAVREAVDVINGYGQMPRGNDSGPRSAKHADPRIVAALNVFGLLSMPDADALRAQYRDLAMRSHPDKFVGMPPQVAQMANLRMQEINTAYSVLRAVAPEPTKPSLDAGREPERPAVPQVELRPDADRGWIVAVAAALVVLVSGRVLGSVDLSEQSQASSPEPVPVSSTVTVTIAGAPDGAKVTVDGEPRPMRFMLPQTEELHTVEVSARGYATYKMTLAGSRDAALTVNLSRARPAHRRRAIVTKSSSADAIQPQADEKDSPAGTEQTDKAGAGEPAERTNAASPAESSEPRHTKEWVDPFGEASAK